MQTGTPLKISEGPVPMSFPAILRNPGIADRYAHIRPASVHASVPPVTRKLRADTKEGKRWVRRSENARFVGNPHIVPATRKDYSLTLPDVRSTFPKPLPPYLPRTAQVPTRVAPAREPISANAGRFTLSLKGMRKTLRRAGGPRTQQLVRDVETEIIAWLRHGGVVLSPDGEQPVQAARPLFDCVSEVSRSVHQLVWSVEEDAFVRYVVHCCARYHDIVSFSKEVNGQRLTYLLRPNVAQPDFRAISALDTPPATDLSTHEFDSESDVLSLSGIESGMDSEVEPAGHADGLSAIAEDASRPPSSLGLGGVPPTLLEEDEQWSVIGGSDIDGDESGHEGDIAQSIGSLSLRDDVDETPRPATLRQAALRSRMLDRGRHNRSTSSPSPSPVRRSQRPTLRQPRIEPPTVKRSRSFYDYLFA
ncbi:hypothetical protein PUNSTDRAFT_63118 [Punctularia strigosozonata HHB-11173 SS5]|uniref:uncharacterized protein n=1 Tax=Punctularia strigosozonata (strain HHB-11173) TaxID=741275 RepID=UPI00044181F8|nr:uncharacterized protein PUNSTDRAFT_63118 [Punctularia strigosozonata HHB-11173 SS5]EIN11659.1 hypothetical protein PUNSTDRAFT_63118 [Punctularia strigosozonata HHB-11173 SS5]